MNSGERKTPYKACCGCSIHLSSLKDYNKNIFHFVLFILNTNLINTVLFCIKYPLADDIRIITTFI